MPLVVRTFDESYELARSLLRNYIDGADVSEGSDYDITARILAALFTGNQGQAEYLADQIFADSAEGDYLERHGIRVGGRLTATKASGSVQITAASGTDTLPVGSALTHTSGTAYITKDPVTIYLPAWSTKTVVTGSSKYRLFLAPNLTSMAVGDLLTVNSQVRAIQGIDTNTGAVDLHEPLLEEPTAGDSVTPTRGATVDIEANETGTAGNKPQGDELTITSPPGAIDAEARIINLSGGDGEESDDAFRSRIVAHDEQPPGNGNLSEFRSKARGVTSVRVSDALVYPGFRGFGTVDVIPVGPPGARFPTDTMVSAVQDLFDDETSEEGAAYVDDILVLAGSLGSYIEVSVTVEFETGGEPDFSWSGVEGWSVQTAGSSSTRLDVGADPTLNNDVAVGDRVLYSARVGGTWRVYERTITAIGATYIDIDEALPFTPVVNPDGRKDLYSSGPLASSVIDALEGVFDGLGWGIGGAGIGTGFQYERYPKPADELDPILRLNSIRCAIKALPGVRDCSLDTVDDTTPADIVPAAQTRVRQGQLTIIFEEP